MKITIVMGAFLPLPPIMGGAVEKGWFALAQEFARRGHDIVQISRRVPQFPTSETIAGVRHVRVSGFDAPASMWWLKALDLAYSLRALRVIEHSDIVVTNTFWLPVLLRGRRRGALYVHVARFPKKQMRLYKHAARLQTPSRSVAEAVIAEVPSMAAKVTVVPYPGPDSREDGMSQFSERENALLFVGRVHPEKGVHLLVEAFGRLPQALRDKWKLLIIGPWESRFGGGGENYRAQLEAVAAGDVKVELRGPVFDPVELERAYRAAALFIYPSLAEKGETFGLAPLEAMAHGCAVLVSNLSCFHDFITEGETGFLFDHRTATPAQTLQSKLMELLHDEQSLARVAEAGHRRSTEYSLPKVAGKFLEDFHHVAREADS